MAGNSSKESDNITTRRFYVSYAPERNQMYNKHGVSKPGAPDGGFSWVVLVIVSLSFCNIGLQLGSFPVMYVAIVDSYGSEHGATGWIGSLYSFAGHIFGIFIGACVDKYGCRIVAIIGSVVGGVGIALSAVRVNVIYLCATYGVIGGFGSAMVFIVNIVMLQTYFDKRRAMAVGIGSSGLSVGSLVAVPIVNGLLEAYGISGTYLVLSGIWLQNLIFSCLYRPVHRISAHGSNYNITDLENTSSESEEPMTNSLSSETYKDSNKSFLRDAIDCSPLRYPKLLLYFAGSFLYTMGAIPFYSHYLSRLTYIGLERNLCVILQMTLEGTTVVSRIACSLIGNTKGVNRVRFLAATVTLGGLVVFTFSLVHSPIALALFGVMHGLLAGGYLSLQHTVLVDISGVDIVAKTTGILSMTISTSILLGIPFAGFIFDVTGSYDYPYMVNGSLHVVGGILLCVLARLHTGLIK